MIKNLLNNLFREKVDLKEDTPEYQKKLLTVNFKGKKNSGKGGGGVISWRKNYSKNNTLYDENKETIVGTTSFNIPRI